jgi:ribosomal protein L37AE/L43A
MMSEEEQKLKDYEAQFLPYHACEECGEEADEWYNDQWLCLDCIVRFDVGQ